MSTTTTTTTTTPRYRIESRIPGQTPWEPEGSGDTFGAEAAAEAAIETLEATNDEGEPVEYRVVEVEVEEHYDQLDADLAEHTGAVCAYRDDHNVYQTAVVYDGETGDALDGTASAELIAASAAEHSGTGAVCAYRDDDGVWQHVPDCEVGLAELQGWEVRIVYVLED